VGISASPVAGAIGVFGGTFDPIHFGHLRLAEELADAIDVASVRFIPTGQPPHRSTPHTPAAHRLAMVETAIAGNPRFTIDTREIDSLRVNYTIDTLRSLRTDLGPHTPIWLFMGADAFLRLSSWHAWRALFDLAHVAVAHRPGFALDTSDALDDALLHELNARLTQQVCAGAAGSILLRPVTQLDISATAIRRALQARQSIRYLLPAGVIDYISTHRLYPAHGC
jgi:nicotinate-nucleotide adenylyltransferase